MSHDPEKAKARRRRYRAKKHAEKFGAGAGDQRGRHHRHARGERNGRWNAGRLLSSHGYVLVRVNPSHRRAFGNGYAYEHDLVMEEHLGRPLAAQEVVHHRNGDKTDNRVENLEVLTGGEHMTLHNAERRRDALGRFTS